MTAVAYQLRLLVFRQSALIPMVVYLALVAAIYASDAGNPVPAAAVTAVALMPVCAWISRLVATSESAPFAEVMLVSVGGRHRYLLARSASTLAVGAALTATSTVWAVLANSTPAHPYRRSDLLIIVGMSLAECLAGIGIGVWIEPPVRAGTAATVVILVSLVSLVVPWVPPLGPLLHGLYQPPMPPPVPLIAYTVQPVAFGALLVGANALRRRG